MLAQKLLIVVKAVLDTPVRVMQEAAAMNGTPIMKQLFQSVEDKGRMRRPADAPADDTPGAEALF